MKYAVGAILVITLLCFAAFTSGLIKSAIADSVVGNPIPVGSGPYKDTFDPDNGDVYVANLDSASVSVINGSTNKVITEITGVTAPP